MIPAREHLSVTNARRISLQYDVQSVGPSGVAKVELWATRDGGRTWESWGTDPDARSPVLVEVDEQGVYGFRVVITNGLGLSSPPPSAGDPADIWIAVDVTKPVVRIRSASLGTGDDAGKLVIRWTAEDPHLAARPVTLLVSNRPDGPWTTIAVGLPDSGQYRWAIDPSTPRPIYLRLEARDAAGNAGVDQTAQPIQLEGLTPQGRIRSFAPAPAEQGSERNGTVVAGKRR